MRVGRDDSGAVAIVVAVAIVALMGFAALAVDVGYMYDTRHQLQAAADAAALAGCSKLIEEDGDAGLAEAEARDYANRNANGAGSGLSVDSVIVHTASEPWSVKVTVSRPVPAWFSRVFGNTGRRIHADAKAIKAPLSGARYLMPWAIPIILDADIDRVEATVVDDRGNVVTGPTVLSSDGPRRFVGTLRAPSSGLGYDVRVAIVNVFGVTEYVGDSKGPQPAARLMVDRSDYPFSAIELSADYIATDDPQTITLTVRTDEVPTKAPSAAIGKKKYTMSGSGTTWSCSIDTADLDDGDGFLATHPVDIYLGNKADDVVDTYIHIRRSTYPVFDVWLESTVTSPGATTDIHVDLNEFDPTVLVPGRVYTLRVGSDGVETGNFGELDFGKIRHDTGYNDGPCPPDPVGVPLGNNVKDWVLDGYGGGVHVGDIIPMSPGKSGWTPRVVQDHIDKYGDIVCAPVVAKFEDKGGGSYDVIVRKFAAFRIVDFGSSSGLKGEVKAEFLEYVTTPSSFSTPGSGTGTVFAAQLVNP